MHNSVRFFVKNIMHQGTSVDERWLPSALQATGGRFPVLAEDRRRGRRLYRGTVPVSYDGTESSEPKSQGSDTSKAHLILMQNIDFFMSDIWSDPFQVSQHL